MYVGLFTLYILSNQGVNDITITERGGSSAHQTEQLKYFDLKIRKENIWSSI